MLRIYLRVKQCKISNGPSEIYPIHSFGDDVCFDSDRKISECKLE